MMYLAQAWSDVFTDVMILSMPLPWVSLFHSQLRTLANPTQLWKLQMAPMRKFCVVLIFQLGLLYVSSEPFFLSLRQASSQSSAWCVQAPQNSWSSIESSTVRLSLIPPQTAAISALLLTLCQKPADTAAGDEDLTCTFSLYFILLAFHHPESLAKKKHPNLDLLTPTVYWPMVESSLGIVGACLPLLRPIVTDTRAKKIFSSLRTMLLLSSSSRPSSRRTESSSLEDAKMEAPQALKLERGPMMV